jgi:hypothetical protein
VHRLGEKALQAPLYRRRRAVGQAPGEPGEAKQQNGDSDRLVQLVEREAGPFLGIAKPSAIWKPSASAISQWRTIATVL